MIVKCPECCYEKEVEKLVKFSICHHCLAEMQKINEEMENGKKYK